MARRLCSPRLYKQARGGIDLATYAGTEDFSPEGTKTGALRLTVTCNDYDGCNGREAPIVSQSIAWDDLSFGKPVGVGATGAVYKGKYRGSGACRKKG